MSKRILMAVLAVLLIAPRVQAAGLAPDHDDFEHEPTAYLWRGHFGADIRSHDFAEIVAASGLGDGPVVYEHTMVSFGTATRILWTDPPQENFRYDFRPVVCLVTTVVDRLLGGRELLSLKAEPDWWSYLLLAHNNSYKLRLSRSLRLTLTTHTGFLLAGYDREDRGVVFTPRLGFELVGAAPGLAPLTNRLHLGVGYGNWWGFEGDHRAVGWTFIAGVALLWAA